MADLKRDAEGFTVMQRTFLEHYLRGQKGIRGCATHAAIAAGYSVRTAYSIGSELTRKPHIRPIIEAHEAEEQRRHRDEWQRKQEVQRARIRAQRDSALRSLWTRWGMTPPEDHESGGREKV